MQNHNNNNNKNHRQKHEGQVWHDQPAAVHKFNKQLADDGQQIQGLSRASPKMEPDKICRSLIRNYSQQWMCKLSYRHERMSGRLKCKFP